MLRRRGRGDHQVCAYARRGAQGSNAVVACCWCCLDGARRTSLARLPSQVSEALKDVDPAAQLKMSAAELCCPGMIDTHVHAPQYQFTGTATDLPLMEWLQTYTFPAERRCADVHLASRICELPPRASRCCTGCGGRAGCAPAGQTGQSRHSRRVVSLGSTEAA